MRKEVDFSKGVRGKHVGKTRIVGPIDDRKKESLEPADPVKKRRTETASRKRRAFREQLLKDVHRNLREVAIHPRPSRKKD